MFGTLGDELYVAPNPNKGTFELVTNNEWYGELRLIDGLGQLVYSQTVAGGTAKISVQNMRKGIYFLLLVQNNKTAKVKKLIIDY
jgi:hypothetical protein